MVTQNTTRIQVSLLKKTGFLNPEDTVIDLSPGAAPVRGTVTSYAQADVINTLGPRFQVSARVHDLAVEQFTDDFVWVLVEGYVDGKTTVLAYGFVDSVAEIETLENGATSKTFELNCLNWAYMLSRFEVYYGLRGAGTATLPEVAVFNQIATQDIAGTSAVPIDVTFKQAINGLLDAGESDTRGYVSMLVPYRDVNTGALQFDEFPWSSAFNFEIQISNTPQRFFVNPVADARGIGRGASIWSFASNYVDANLTEVFTKTIRVDAAGAKLLIVYRDKPFYSSAKGSPAQNEWITPNQNFPLTVHERIREDFVQRKVSTSNAALKNVFSLKTPLAQEDLQAELVFGSDFNETSIARFGVRLDQRDMKVLCLQDGNVLDGTRTYRALVRDYNSANHLFSAGTLRCAGPDFVLNVGDKLIIRDVSRQEDEQFYIEAVEHSWSDYRSGFQTTVSVTRGLKGALGQTDDKLVKLINRLADEFEQVTNAADVAANTDDTALSQIVAIEGDVHPRCVWPAVNRTVLSDFGTRPHPRTGIFQKHNGIDIDGAIGDPIYAVADGTIATVGSDSGRGNYVIINHGNGVTSHYFHMNSTNVTAGAPVMQGAVIGELGNTGSVAPGPGGDGSHLHIEMHVNGVPKHPDFWLRPERVRTSDATLPRLPKIAITTSEIKTRNMSTIDQNMSEVP